MSKNQIDKSQYDFENYLNKNRWINIWHQIDEVMSLQPKSLLEVGPGPGLLKAILEHFKRSQWKQWILIMKLKPNYVASADDLPFDDNTYDCVCAFQMLEHLPYNQSLIAFEEMVRVAKKILLSVCLMLVKSGFIRSISQKSVRKFFMFQSLFSKKKITCLIENTIGKLIKRGFRCQKY
jgi:ubiquinone/menaquinone biosynthesis C-methylase UbiE